MAIISLVLQQSHPILRHLSSLYLVIAKDKAVLFLCFMKIDIQTHRKIGGVVMFCPSSVIFLVRRVSWSVFLYLLKKTLVKQLVQNYANACHLYYQFSLLLQRVLFKM